VNLGPLGCSAAKGFTRGTHRVRSPAETLAEYRRVMPTLGITRLANVTGLDDIGVPVCVAIRPNARSLATSQGKGLDIDAAKASALMEAIEFWHAEHVRAPLCRESYAVLAAGEDVLDPSQIPLRPGAAFVATTPRLWVSGWDLLRERAVWVPHDCVAVDDLEPHGGAVFSQTSNGLASGNHLLEAAVHGLCEVIERDAEVLWRLSDDSRRVDLATVDDPSCAEVLARLAAAGVYTAVWDITSDVGVPAYTCMLTSSPQARGWRSVGFYNGFGAHLSPAVALLRALTEAVQTRLTYISGSRDDVFPAQYADANDPEAMQEVWKELQGDTPTVDFGARRSLATDTFDGDLQVILEALRRVGIASAAVVDLSRPELGVPVVKVVVAGLEGSYTAAELGPRAKRLVAPEGEAEAASEGGA
jgi:YcaO-like protein with predicted kinase domain